MAFSESNRDYRLPAHHVQLVPKRKSGARRITPKECYRIEVKDGLAVRHRTT